MAYLTGWSEVGQVVNLRDDCQSALQDSPQVPHFERGREKRWQATAAQVGNLPHIALLLLSATVLADTIPGEPNYTVQSITNSASNVAGQFAPNTFLTIYGQNLSYVTKAISPGDIEAQTLPTTLGNVRVLLNLIPADVYYVSSGQVNVLIPASLKPGTATLRLLNNGASGPSVSLMLNNAAPGLFQLDAVNILATHGNGPVITPVSPAKRGEVIVMYATGLGITTPPAIPDKLPIGVAVVTDLANFKVLLNGVAVDPRAIQYAGVTPGFAGLFQINLKLPDDAPLNPEVRAGYPDSMSAPGKLLPLQ